MGAPSLEQRRRLGSANPPIQSISDFFNVAAGRQRSVEVRRVALLNATAPDRKQQPKSRSLRLLSGGPQPNEGAGDAPATFLGG